MLCNELIGCPANYMFISLYELLLPLPAEDPALLLRPDVDAEVGGPTGAGSGALLAEAHREAVPVAALQLARAEVVVFRRRIPALGAHGVDGLVGWYSIVQYSIV